MGITTEPTTHFLAKYAIIGGWVLLFLTTALAYFPGLSGPFVSDDFGHIDSLGDFGGVTDWETFRAYVLGGHAGPTGRPISLFTFLIDGNNWPADPWPFKRTNLVIHLINGALLGVLISRILRVLNYGKSAVQSITLVSVAFWMLHPFLVSTTLYAVQRMAQLSTLFIFAGLIGHLYGRSMLRRDTTKAYLIMTLSIGLCTVLAVLSKENGILLPLLIGVVEFTVLASQGERLAALDRRWSFVFVTAPSLLIVAYLGQGAFNSDFFNVVAPRDFSIYERLLTQPRILFDYLQNWFIPKLYTTGVFQDHYIKSTGIFSPMTTALSILMCATVIGFAIRVRRKWPLVALAALFFYASHLLESTVLNLELYFEHRNYLATCFLFVPVIAFFQKKTTRTTFAIVALGFALMLSGFTRYSSTVWQDFSSMVHASARKAPTSARAQAEYARDLFNANRHEEALRVMDTAIATIPDEKPHLQLNRLMMLCRLGVLDAGEFERVANVVSNKIYDPRLAGIYSEFATGVIEGNCPDVTLLALRDMFADMLAVAQNFDKPSLRLTQIKYLIGYVELSNGEPAQAQKAFEESLRANPNATLAMNMARLLASNGYFDEALHVLNVALSVIEFGPQSGILRKGPSKTDIMELQAFVQADMKRAHADD